MLSAYKASRKAQTAASAAAMTPEQKAAQASLKLQELRARTEADPTIPDNIKKQRLLLIDKRLGKLEVPGGK